jgi:hypothetical protein
MRPVFAGVLAERAAHRLGLGTAPTARLGVAMRHRHHAWPHGGERRRQWGQPHRALQVGFAGLCCGKRGKSAIPGRPMFEEYSRAHPPNVGSQLQGS